MGFSANDYSVISLPDIVEQPYGLYPALNAFSGEYRVDDYREWVDQSNGDPMPAPLAVYIQNNLCQQNHPRSAEAVQHELLLQRQLIASDRPMQQLLCAGNLLAAYSDDQLYQLIENVQKAFMIAPESQHDWCADVGTLLLPPARMRLLGILGFSGVRFTYQGGSSPESKLEELVTTVHVAQEAGMQTVALDLSAEVGRSTESIEELKILLQAVSRVRVMAADGAYVIGLLKNQGFTALSAGWYVHADDPWLRAKSANALYWSLIGVSEMHSPDIVGIGPGAISAVGECYSANAAVGACYQASIIEQGKLPMVSGLELEADDILRREIMGMILAAGIIRISYIEDKWGICFTQFFAQESRQLGELEGRGWVSRQEGDIVIIVHGCQALGSLCQLFDRRVRVTSNYSSGNTQTKGRE